MISLIDWKITREGDISSLEIEKIYECCYVGTELSLDDRLSWIDKHIEAVAGYKVVVSYNHETAEISLSNQPDGLNVASLAHLSTPRGRILFDATSLLLPELIYLMEWANLNSKAFDVIYVEPAEYSGSYKQKIGVQSIDYSLSGDGFGINMLPRFTTPVDESHLIVALGYEGHRFGAMLISDEITPRSITGILGVPPFVLGWEKNTFAKNHQEMSEARKHYNADFKVIAANDPLQNYDMIELIHHATTAENPRRRVRLILAPIGTKPVALAMSWFAVNHKGTGILYDFVKKKSKRSIGVGKVHQWYFSSVTGSTSEQANSVCL